MSDINGIPDEEEMTESVSPYAAAASHLDSMAEKLGKGHIDYYTLKTHAKYLSKPDRESHLVSASLLKTHDTDASDKILDAVYHHSDVGSVGEYYKNSGYVRLKEDLEVSGEQEIRPEFKGEYPEEFFTNPVVVNSCTDTSHNITVAGQTLDVPLHHLQPKAIGESQLQELNTERYADQDWHNQQANRQKKHMIHTEDGKKHGPFSSKENAEKFASSRKDLKSPKYVAESLEESSGNIKFHFVNDEMIHVHKGGEKIGHISLKDKGEYQFVPVKNRNFEGKIHTNLQDCTKEVMDTYSQDLKEETMEENKLQESEALSLKEAFNDKLGSMTEFKVSLGEEVKGIFESQQLDEEVGNQLIAVFESVVTSAAKTHLEKINESAAELFSDLVSAKFTQMDEEVSDYLESVVNEWFEENKPAVIESQRVVAVESFIKNLSSVLQSAGLMVEGCGVEKKEEKVEESVTPEVDVVALQEELNSYKKAAALESVCKGMTMVKAEKVRSLSEALEYHNQEDYTRKLQIIAESIGAKAEESSGSTIQEESDQVVEEIVVEEKIPVVESKQEVEDEVAFLAKAMKLRNKF